MNRKPFIFGVVITLILFAAMNVVVSIVSSRGLGGVFTIGFPVPVYQHYVSDALRPLPERGWDEWVHFGVPELIVDIIITTFSVFGAGWLSQVTWAKLRGRQTYR